MPYIRQEDRSRAQYAPQTPGELNYAITLLMLKSDPGLLASNIRTFIHEYKPHELLSYARANEIVGALTCCGLEYKRRVNSKTLDYFQRLVTLLAVRDKYYTEVVAPYEDRKIAENGDVYP